jgi:acyl-coenzyme A thioesterase PaaI-like protein
MVVSEKVLKWAMRLYPPLLVQRIWVQYFDKGFTGVSVKISKSIFNKNFNNSIFGGTIFSAADPFYALLFHQVLQRRGYTVRVWLKSAQIQYLKPGRTNLYFNIHITEEEIAEAEEVLKTVGKFVKAYPVEMYDKDGVLCVTVINEVYVRNLYAGEDKTVAY